MTFLHGKELCDKWRTSGIFFKMGTSSSKRRQKKPSEPPAKRLKM
jgi:hypothetical protein